MGIRKLRMVTFAVIALLAGGTTSVALASGNGKSGSNGNSGTHVKSVTHGKSGKSGGKGDSNRGDVWLDNVNQPSGPGHEHDPHLACADINLWGSKMGDPSGSYTIDGWPPSGHKGQAYSSTWSYNQAQGGSQVMDVIDVSTLISNAQNNGDTPKNKQGYHFKLQFVQDPHKHKTFWVKCPALSAPTTTTTSTTSTTGTTTNTTSSTPTSTSTTTTSSSTAPTTTTTSSTTGAVKAVHKKRKRHHKKRLSRRPRVSAGFTG